MKALHAWRGRATEPTLLRRSVALVLAAFFVVWGVLLAYQYLRYERADAGEQPFRRFSLAVLAAVEDIEDPREAAAALKATAHWLNIRRREIGRLPGEVQFELKDLQGRLVYGGITVDSAPHLDFRGAGRRWQLRIAEPRRTATSFFAYNLPFIGEYLLLALPFVLLPVWLSVRAGLRPLAQFAATLSRRRPDDLRPLQPAPRHRELKPLAAAIDGLLQRLQQRFESERRFVQDAAHEIRTPLAVVATQAHVLAHAQAQDERARAASLLHQAIARASHVAQQLLMLASLDGGRAAPQRRLDVAQAVRELLAQLAPQAMRRGIELSLDAPDQLWCDVDEPAFQSIVVNLVDNAIRYGREGGSVAVKLSADEERMVLQVRDDGPGIPAADRERVFERFYRAAGTESPGSGLGLAIVRQAAGRMGGHACIVDGLDGRGVGLDVSLPVPGFRPG